MLFLQFLKYFVVSALNFIKSSLLRAYIVIHKFDVLCLMETYLSVSISNNDGSLEVVGYNVFRADHLSHPKRGCVCIYYRNSLPVRVLSIHYLRVSINFEIIIWGKLCNLPIRITTTIYWACIPCCRFLFLYWLNIYITAKFSNGIWGAHLITSKLLSSNNLCEIQSKNSLSASIWTENKALRKS